MSLGLNVSSIILRGYPETSPWDLTPTVHGVRPPHLDAFKCLNEPAFTHVRNAALAQAQKTGLNPFHYVCMGNPFLLDNPAPENIALPFNPVPSGVLPLAQYILPDQQTISFAKEIRANGTSIICRVRIGPDFRVLKLVSVQQ